MSTALPLPHHQLLIKTQALVSAGPYLTAADAILTTGHTRYRLHKMGEDGMLPSRRTGAQTRVYDTRAVVSEAYRQGRLLLTDVLRTAAGECLDETDFAHALTQANAGTWYTLIRRNHMPPDWPSWAAWYAGNEGRAQAYLAEEQHEHRMETETLAARGLSRRRLWCPDLPLTLFGRYQSKRFMMLAESGACVRVLPVRRFTYLELQSPVPDLEVLPDAVYVRRYTQLGTRNGATRITDPDLVAATQHFGHWLYTTHAGLLTHFSDDRTRVSA